MTDRRIWLPVGGAVALVAAIVGLILLGRSDVEVLPLTVGVPASDTARGSEAEIDLDAAIYRPGSATAQEPRPAVLLAHGFLGDRSGLDARARELAADGFVVMTWSARGFGASGGEVGLADPGAEIADVSRLVDSLAERPEVLLDEPGDPRVAIVGGSYGAGTALLAATQEPRLDAVVAAAGWHSLSRSLAPNAATGPDEVAPGVLKASWTSLLFTANALPSESLAPPSDTRTSDQPDPPGPPEAGPSEAATEPPTVEGDPPELGSLGPGALDQAIDPCGRFTAEICALYLEVAGDGVLTASSRALLDERSPAGRLGSVTAPTLLLQGQDDTLFDLAESRRNAGEIAATGTPVRVRWLTGGHEVVGGAGSDEQLAEIGAWLDRWLRNGTGSTDPVFTWTDQAADATRDREALPAAGSDETLRFALAADGSLRDPGTLDDPDGADTLEETGRQTVTISSPPGGQPAALSALPGGGALVGFLPATDIPGQHVAFDSEPVTEDTTFLGPPTMSLQVLEAEVEADVAIDENDRQPGRFVIGDGGEARLFVKLTDVAANGASTLIHQGVTPVRTTALPAELEVELPDLAYRLQADHHLRLTIATTDQAFANRTDAASTRLALGSGAATLQLPVVAAPATTGAGPLLAGSTVALVLASAWWLRRRSAAARAATHPGAAPTGASRVEVTGPPPIAIRGLTKRYRDGHLAVDGLDLTVGQGQVMGLLGPNGAGKTTSLRMLLGLSMPTAGAIQLFGHDIRPGHPVLERVGALVEGPGFVPELPGIDNLKLYWRAGGRHLDEADLPWALEVADLGDAIRKPVRTYSHGMKQRLAIAQALLGRPELLVLDEPTDGLDPEQIRAMRELLARLGDEGHTVLVSSHLLSEVEQMCTHVAVVHRGRLLASGSIAELVGAGRTVVVETDDRDRARAVLGRHLDPASIQPSGAGLAVTLGDSDPADLVTWLVADGLRIQALTPRGKLEDAFLSLTGQPAPDADGGRP